MAEGRDDSEIALLKDLKQDLKDLTEDRDSVIQRVMSDLSKAPAPKQLLVGTSAGWLAGYATMKIGKMAATAVGGTLLILQIAHHKGYIKEGIHTHCCLLRSFSFYLRGRQARSDLYRLGTLAVCPHVCVYVSVRNEINPFSLLGALV